MSTHNYRDALYSKIFITKQLRRTTRLTAAVVYSWIFEYFVGRNTMVNSMRLQS